jgi:hypothetical protein
MRRFVFGCLGFLVASLVSVCGWYVFAQGGVSSAAISMARAGLPPIPEAVLVEEFVNYHRHQIPEPMGAAVALDLRWGAAACGPRQPEAVLQVGLANRRKRFDAGGADRERQAGAVGVRRSIAGR